MVGGKRNAVLSTNPHSVKRQKRTAALTPAALLRERAVKADASFRGYHARKFRLSAAYLNAADNQTREVLMKEHLDMHFLIR